MKLNRALPLLLCLPLAGRGQEATVAEKFTLRDTLTANVLYANLSLLFLISDDRNSKQADFNTVNSAHLRYVVNRGDVDLLCRQNVERDNDGAYSYSHYVALSASMRKYNAIPRNRVTFRKRYAEALLIFQNNSERGLTSRLQAGALLYPYALHRPKLKLNFGVGGVADRSAWHVNNADAIAACPQELQDKIRYVNSHVKLKRNKYQVHCEFRPMALVNASYRATKILDFRFTASYQQSLASPYSREVQAAYPDLGKVYPYLLSTFEVNTSVHPRISVQAFFAVDYENNNLTLYASSWQYRGLFGLTFHLQEKEL